MQRRVAYARSNGVCTFRLFAGGAERRLPLVRGRVRAAMNATRVAHWGALLSLCSNLLFSPFFFTQLADTGWSVFVFALHLERVLIAKEIF